MRTLGAALMIAGMACASAYAQNHAPTVDAGNDTTIRLGIGFNFSFVQAGDPDNDPLTYAWTVVSGTAGGDSIIRPNALGTRVTFSLAGNYLFSIVVSDGSLTASDTIKVVVQDSLRPKVLTPGAGQKVLAGSTSTITWQVDPPGASISIELSQDNGMTWELLNTQGHVSGGTFDWTVTDALSDSCLIQIYPYGFKNNILAVSGMFAIVDHIDSSSVKHSGFGSGAFVRGTAFPMGAFQVDGRLIPARRDRGPTSCDLSVDNRARPAKTVKPRLHR